MAGNTKTGIQVKMESKAEALNLVGLLGCSGITNPFSINSPTLTNACLADAESAVRNGWVKNLPTAELALWQVPPVTIKGEDAALDLNQRITEVALKADPKTDIVFLCARGPNDCNKDPIKKEELLYVVGSTTGARLTAEMQSNRALAITPAHAAINALFDAVMSPENFRTTKSGRELTVEETVADIRTRTPKQEIDAAFKQCISNVGEIANCAKVAARKGLGMVVDEGITYEGTKFVGTKKKPASLARQP